MRGPRLQEPGGQSPGTALGSCLQGSRPWDQRAGLREMSKSVAQRARSHRDSNSDRWIQSPECSPLHHGTSPRAASYVRLETGEHLFTYHPSSSLVIPRHVFYPSVKAGLRLTCVAAHPSCFLSAPLLPPPFLLALASQQTR